MAKACAFCIHEDRQELEAALRSRAKTQNQVATILGIDRSCVSRHMKEHTSQGDSQSIDELQRQIVALRDRLDTIEQEFKAHRSWSGHRRF